MCKFREVAEYICNSKLGNLEIIQELGSGTMGHAFLLSNNQVLKISTQDSEYYVSKSLVGRNEEFPRLNNIHKTFLIKGVQLIDWKEEYECYAILQDFLDTDREFYNLVELNSLWEEFSFAYPHVPYSCIFETLRVMHNYSMSGYRDDYENLYSDLMQFMDDCGDIVHQVNELLEILDDCEQIGIDNSDLGLCNLGTDDNGNLVLFDLGYSNTFKEVEPTEEELVILN